MKLKFIIVGHVYKVAAEAEASVTAHLPANIKHLLRAEALSTGKTVSGLVREWMVLCAGFAIEERLDLLVAA
ncbi:MAG: hypothetical protein DCC55_23480 [Chloroflexi bacterium]|nr:MAG: hypothetical protein DCC55_23480 [Chloroflexota bacterium]